MQALLKIVMTLLVLHGAVSRRAGLEDADRAEAPKKNGGGGMFSGLGWSQGKSTKSTKSTKSRGGKRKPMQLGLPNMFNNGGKTTKSSSSKGKSTKSRGGKPAQTQTGLSRMFNGGNSGGKPNSGGKSKSKHYSQGTRPSQGLFGTGGTSTYGTSTRTHNPRGMQHSRQGGWSQPAPYGTHPNQHHTKHGYKQYKKQKKYGYGPHGPTAPHGPAQVKTCNTACGATEFHGHKFNVAVQQLQPRQCAHCQWQTALTQCDMKMPVNLVTTTMSRACCQVIPHPPECNGRYGRAHVGGGGQAPRAHGLPPHPPPHVAGFHQPHLPPAPYGPMQMPYNNFNQEEEDDDDEDEDDDDDEEEDDEDDEEEEDEEDGDGKRN
eukprot:TRINITY_DN36957_c0_g1_i1.p1 TRINITY_DN36957_c0_g1~~TRINITY_DN36957_c0_g1_i1.p1  ORF type:complete len:375 (+),score=27.95 TRINITY_DN36957_c0_g1_i1:54-1178(+)